SVKLIGMSLIARDILALSRDYDAELGTDASRSAINWANALLRTCEARIADATLSHPTRDSLRDRLTALAQMTRELAFKMDFAFLLRDDRLLLLIGYRVDDDALDDSGYDLLASEARLSSLRSGAG